MGDLSTHKAIFADVAAPLLTSRLGLTGSQALCFELGNWLRDVSQFRDPYANAQKKIELYQTKMKGVVSEAFGHKLRGLLNELFGPHYKYDSDKLFVAGAFGEWFKQMLTAYGMYAFNLGPRLDALKQLASPSTADILSEADFGRLFKDRFTQYFPHEHLDFPPTGDEKLLGDWSKFSAIAQIPGTRRKVLAYLETFIDYIAYNFLQCEKDLRQLLLQRSNGLRGSDQQQTWESTLKTVLVRLGRVSHAVEDYYFHSNFCEQAFLYAAIGPRAEDIELRSYFAVPQVGRLAEAAKRKLFRRVRAPQLDKDTAGKSILSTSGSEVAPCIFTGMFGSEDILHSFSDGFESIASIQGNELFVKSLGSTLFKYVLEPEMRRKLVKVSGSSVVNNDKKIEDVNAQHNDEVKAGIMVQRAAKLRGMSPLFADSIERANQVDRALAITAEGVVLGNASIGMVLLTLAANVEAADQNSSRIARGMDAKPEDKHYLASNNGESGENIGSHSLMAKDSIRKLPLRSEADRMARFAVGVVMNVLTTQVIKPRSRCVDWGDLLRRLMCHPAQAPGQWVQRVLGSAAVAPKVFEPKLVESSQVEEMLRTGAKQTDALEQSYRDLYLNAEEIWKKMTA